MSVCHTWGHDYEKTATTHDSGAEATLSVTLLVNGETRQADIEPRQVLVDVLRNELHLTGTKKACGEGDCGACTVLLDGRAVYSCLILGVECDERQIVTIEGLAEDGRLDPVQQAFIDNDALQCGFCTPGQIMNIKGLLNESATPDAAELRRTLAGNLCRCGAYANIHDAACAVAGIAPDDET